MTKHYSLGDDRMYTGYGFSDIRESINRGYQALHGDRVEERQRVNGQPNGYKPVSEAELQASKVTAANYKPAHGGYCA